MSNEIIQQITNRVLDLVIIEINKTEMKQTIQTRVIHPLMEMIFKQLYPYIYTLVIVVFLMFIMLIVMLTTLLMYLRK